MVDFHQRYFRTTNEEGNTTDWWLLTVTTAAQLGVAAALRAMPLSAWRLRAGRCRPLGRFLVRGSNERIAWAIEATGRRLGRASTCLIRALVAELLLDAHEGPMTLTIGVRRTAAGAFHAHAWLACEDRVLVGATSEDYLPMASWTGLPG
jgi:hypothetical protein